MLRDFQTFRMKGRFSTLCMKELISITVNVDNKLRYFGNLGRIWILIYDALRDLVSFAQFKEQEKHPWKSVTFSKVCEK